MAIDKRNATTELQLMLNDAIQLLPKANNLYGISTNVLELSKYKAQVEALKKRNEGTIEELEIFGKLAELDFIFGVLQDLHPEHDDAFNFGPNPADVNLDLALERRTDAVPESDPNILSKVLDLLMSGEEFRLSTGTEIDFVAQLDEKYEVEVERDRYDLAEHIIPHLKMMIYGQTTRSRYEKNRVIESTPAYPPEIIAHSAHQIRKGLSPNTETILLWLYFYELGFTQVWIAQWFDIAQSTVHDRIMKFKKFLRTGTNLTKPGLCPAPHTETKAIVKEAKNE